jgi:predicted aldo/keto reductase-like oxidoreductase
MYAVDYEDLRLARDEYAMLGADASACLSCDSKPCAGACPQGIPIDSLLGPAHLALKSV